MTKKFMEKTVYNSTYIPFDEYTSPAIKSKLFDYANAPAVLCIDCHVLLYPNSLKRLIEYYDEHPNTKDLLQGPLLHENLKGISTHFNLKWRDRMHGIWAKHNTLGYDVDDPSFEIPAQGMGLFSCQKDAWLGYNKHFREFGGEEGYIHQKYRQHGHKVLCLPFLRWVHRFYRPEGTPYPLSDKSRIRNYLIGHMELKIPLDKIIYHFVKQKGIVTKETMQQLIITTTKETGYTPIFKSKELGGYVTQ